METVESSVREFWQDKARGLVLGQACADAIAVPFLGRVAVSTEQFAAQRRGPDNLLRYGAATALTTAVAERAAALGPDLEIGADALATSMAHMWWTSQDRAGYGIDDHRQFQALLSDQERAAGRVPTCRGRGSASALRCPSGCWRWPPPPCRGWLRLRAPARR